MATGAYTGEGSSTGAPGRASEAAFDLRVSVVGGRPERFAFDRAYVRVGRGADCDLRIEHACVAREQFAVERTVGVSGDARFRIVPSERATNPTFVAGHPAVEGVLRPGDVIAVGEVRVVLEHGRVGRRGAGRDRSARDGGTGSVAGAPSPGGMPPLRVALLAATAAMAVVVGWLLLAPRDDGGARELASTQVPLFGADAFREPHCQSRVECDTKAHEAYASGRKLFATAAADPGNYYRAAIELARARSYREQSGRPLADLADVDERAAAARREAEAAYDDARFALKRAVAAGDVRRSAEAAAQLARIVPDERHPYRVQLDAYRRTLPRPKRPAGSQLEPQ